MPLPASALVADGLGTLGADGGAGVELSEAPARATPPVASTAAVVAVAMMVRSFMR
jgi:hypothetical protein